MTDGVCNKLCANSGITHISGKRNAVCAGFSNTFLRVCRGMRRAVNGDVGSSLSQCNGDGGAESSRRAGDKCDFTFEIEFVEYQGNGPFCGLEARISGRPCATSLPV